MKTLRGIYLVLAILLGIAGIVQCVRWSSFVPISSGYLINFLPAAFFLSAYLISTKIEYVVSKTFYRFAFHLSAISLCFQAFCYTGFVGYVAEIIHVCTTTVTDVAEYKQILNESWYPRELASHFPRDIPPDARNVRFSYEPHFLQGGSHIRLQYTTSPQEILALNDRFSKLKTTSFFGETIVDHGNLKEEMQTTDIYKSGFGIPRFSEDFEVMVFDQLNPENRFSNHGQTHGVAINKSHSEIVYWAESW